jgi:hypothetical protein
LIERNGPPPVPFILNVGITGHRSHSLNSAAAGALTGRLTDNLRLIELAGRRLLADSPEFFAEEPPRFRLISPLADGADQAAAEAALALGWELQAILPFERARYRASLEDEPSRVSFDRLLGRATIALELPGDGDGEVGDYVMTGRATVAHSDILIAVWDGEPARGRGGTAEVASQAIVTGTGLIHLPPDPDRECRLVWSAFDPDVLTVDDNQSVSRPCDDQHLDALLRNILLPPNDAEERTFLRRFYAERVRPFRTRIEYPLLLSVFGVRRIRAGDFAESHCQRQIEEEWERYRSACAEAHEIAAPIDVLAPAYCRADRLATHFAQTYRSGHIFSFVLGGAAVCLGLSAFIAPQFKIYFAIAEIIITIAIILNAVIGNRSEWHRRWLDYRQLAERLRPMRSLKMLGIAAPDPPGTRTNPVPRRWIDWYAIAIWRAMGAPGGAIDRECAKRLAVAIADHEVEPQVGYHRRNAVLVETLDRRLEFVGTGLFAATLLVAGANLIGILSGAPFVETYGDWFNLIEAGFPALGTAIFGIRFQADFGGDAIRSLATAQTLGRIDGELRKDIDLSRAADLAEQAARIMLSDLDEWRLVNQQRDLSVG